MERGNRVLRLSATVLLGVLLIVPCIFPSSEGASYRTESIVVEGDEGFVDAGFTGSGTAEDPYVLSEINLDASFKLYGIRVSNTTAHFRIEGCTVHDSYSPDRDPLNLSASGSGILLINVTNAVIEDYLGDFNVRGVTVVRSSNVIINDSRFNNNIEAGVHLVDCLDSSVRVANSTFTVGSGDDGVLLERCQAVKVIDNTVSGGDNGIVVRAGGSGLGGHLVEGNELSGQSGSGISLGGSSATSGDQVLNNTVRGAGGSGVLISFGTSEMISGNDISGCSQGIEVGWTDNEVSLNVLSNNTRGVLVGTDADRNMISRNRIVDGAFGVLISPGQGSEVLNNSISRMTKVDSAVGVYLGIGAVKDALVAGNEISECNVGIRAATVAGQEISGLSITNNNISGSLKEGAYLLYTVDSEIVNSSFLSGGSNGIYLGAGCHDLFLDGNEVSYNEGSGLYVRSAFDNVMTNNLLISNVLEGIYLEAGSGNLIHTNALLFNKDSGRQYSPLRPQAFCGVAGNNWSLGTGNLWADWLSPDLNDDGIVDLPYNISGGFQDPFPLTSIPGLEIPADITPPEIISYAPQGLNAEQGDSITITFSEDMNASTVVVMVNDVTQNGTWNDRTFELDIGLDFETDYIVTVNGQDLSGNNMTEFSWTFRTEGPNATVSGRVIDEDGNPLAGVRVVLDGVEAVTGDDGRFSLEVAPGNYSFEFWKDDYTAHTLSIHVLPGEDQDIGDMEMVYGREGGIVLTPSFFEMLLLVLAIVIVAGIVVIYLRRRKR